jgi:hypothetical protein
MKDLLSNALIRAINNKHTSIAGLVWLACKLGAIWLPKYKTQFEATEAIAVAYGLIMAGDAKASVQQPGQVPTTPPTTPP